MKLLSRFSSIIALLIANLIPLYGAVALGWNIFSIMLTYWFESAIIGFYTIRKMKKAEGKAGTNNFYINGQLASHANFKLSNFLVPFFSLHYGIFMFVHLIFLVIVFGSRDVHWLAVFLSFLSLFASHTISYYGNYIGKEEYRTASSVKLFLGPYPRIFVMHITVILGAMLAKAMGGSASGLALMVVLKTIVDLSAHLAEHRKAQTHILVADQPNSENVIVLESESKAERM